MSHRYFITLFIIFIGIVFLWQFNAASVIFGKGILSVATPFWKAEKYITQKVFEYSVFIKSKKSLFEENNVLKEEKKEFALKLLNNKFLIRENKELKEILNRQEDEKKIILAVVLVKPNRSPYDTLIIDRGAREGIKVGNIVVVSGDLIIGRIGGVSGESAQVVLFSSPGEEIDVVIGEEYIAAIARGVGSGNFEVILPRGVDVKEGDVAAFPTIDFKILGVVEKIKIKTTDSFQTILFKSPVNIYELRFVEVILD